MPPKKARQQPPTSAVAAIPSLPAPTPQPATALTETHTPPAPPTAAVGITQAQKQALVDNLQLEITERARKLRAQYALQAQGLRSRLEMRVNRIPQALRKRKMGDLVEELAGERKVVEAVGVDVGVDVGGKRKSDRISNDKENEGDDEKENTAPSQPTTHDLPNPKKRVKTASTAPAPVANTKTARTTSRTAKQQPLASTVLSPKSHNSRTLPRSPFKAPTSPDKASYKPTSPAKPPAQPIANATGGRTASRAQAKTTTAKRQAAPALATVQQENVGRSSEASDTSASTATTVVTKLKGRAAATKKAVGSVAARAGMGGKRAGVGANAKKENVPPPPSTTAAAGRSLRKRG